METVVANRVKIFENDDKKLFESRFPQTGLQAIKAAMANLAKSLRSE